MFYPVLYSEQSFFLSVINAKATEEFRVSPLSQKHSQKIFCQTYKISTTWHNDRNGIEPLAMVGYRSWLLFLILINDLLDMFCILFAFSQTLLSCEGTDCLVMQEKASIARNATTTHYIQVNPYGTIRKRQRMTTKTLHTEDNIAYDSGRLIGQMS